MRKTLRRLIEDEHFAVTELESYGNRVEFLANELSSCDRDSYLYKFCKEDHDKTIAERDKAMEKLNAVRKELKEYLVNIMENY